MTTRKILLIVIVLGLFFSPYLHSGRNSLIWYDAGYYVTEINRYLQLPIENLFDHIAIFHEPVGILWTSTFFIITGADVLEYFRYILFFILIAKTIVLLLIFKKEQWTKNYIWVMLFLISSVSIHIFYLFLYRQYLLDFLFLVLIYFACYKSNKINLKFGFILSILISGIYGGHRWILVITGLFLIGYLIFITFRVKNYKRTILFIISLWIFVTLLSIPYLKLTFRENLKIFNDFVSSVKLTQESVYGVQNQWTSLFYGKWMSEKKGVIDFFIDDGLLILQWLLFIAYFRRKGTSSKVILFLILLMFVVINSSSPFSARTVWYFFMLLYLWINWQKIPKLVLILWVMVPLIFQTMYIVKKIPQKNIIERIDKPLSQINKKESFIITIGSNWMLLAQLGFRTYEAECFSSLRFNGEFCPVQLPYIYGSDYFINWHKGSIKIIDETIKNIYIILEASRVGTFSKEWILDPKEWAESDLYESTDIFCINTFKNFCYAYKMK